jgi:hypothetical protein
VLCNYYKRYCGILTEAVKTAKKFCYNKFTINYSNKTKSIWYILNNVTGKSTNNCDIRPLIIDGDGEKCNSHQITANVFNTYFASVTDKWSDKKLYDF